ncbi:unnamed protein product [Brachionus calyciflorus]|uniref:Uncharacterized protein n=1 Tax=Brachionus calyciflorus TaxID=104777 RepID=A0A814CPL2_9BILA|nr:unnamed protein product [Brachionus calyciflorus]
MSQGPRKIGVLDYVISDSSFRINELEIGPQLGMSEQGHLRIIFDYLCTVKLSENKEQNQTKKFNYTKTNFRESNEYFSRLDWNQLFKDKTIDEMYVIFLRSYEVTRQMFVLKKKPGQKKEMSSWMNSDVRNMINEKYKPWKRYSSKGWKKKHYAKYKIVRDKRNRLKYTMKRK